jgi:PleD family two-component response regulator
MKKVILIVDDERTIAKAIDQHFSKKGFETKIAYDGEQALEQVKDFKPDLILLDIIMPKVDGMTVLKQLKASEKTKDIPVIMLTNLGTEKTIEGAKKEGSTDYLVKVDYTLSQLDKKVDEVLK